MQINMCLSWHILFNRCLCGRCEAMPSAVESMCCREVDAYWSLVQNLDPPEDITCLTLHPPQKILPASHSIQGLIEASCLNPFVLQIAYLNFRQEHGPLQGSRPEYVLSKNDFSLQFKEPAFLHQNSKSC